MYLIISLTIVVAPNSPAQMSAQPEPAGSQGAQSAGATGAASVDSLQQSQTHCFHLSRQPTTVTSTLCSLESTAFNSHKHTVFT